MHVTRLASRSLQVSRDEEALSISCMASLTRRQKIPYGTTWQGHHPDLALGEAVRDATLCAPHFFLSNLLCVFSGFTHYDYPGIYQYQDFHHCGLEPGDNIMNYDNATEVWTCQLDGLAEYAFRLVLTLYVSVLIV
jgi:hypothetical protein